MVEHVGAFLRTKRPALSNPSTWKAHRPNSPTPANVYMMVQRRALAAGIRTKISCHSFRATGITTYLENGGKLEVAQQMDGHESARTPPLFHRPHRSPRPAR